MLADARIGYRCFSVPGGMSEVWLFQRGDTVELHARNGTGGGVNHWARCSKDNCFGESATPSGTCFAHTERPLRMALLQQCATQGSRLSLRGNILRNDAVEDLLVLCFKPGVSEKGAIDFAAAQIYCDLRLRNVKIPAGTSFLATHFYEGLFVEDCEIDEPFNLSHSLLERGASFVRCIFKKQVNLSSITSRSNGIQFESCTFTETLNAESANTALFQIAKSSIDSQLILRNSTSTADRRVAFSIRGSQISGQIDVSDSNFTNFTISDCKLPVLNVLGPFQAEDCSIERTTFESRVAVQVAGDRADFSGSHFGAGGSITAERCRISLRQVSLGSTLRVSSIPGATMAEVVNIHDADAGAMSFGGVDMRRCCFNSAHGLASVTIEPTVVLPQSSWPERRRCIADEFAWRLRRGGLWGGYLARRWHLAGTALQVATLKDDPKGFRDSFELRRVELPVLEAGQVAGTYRALRRSMEGSFDAMSAAEFYFGEMEMRRHSKASSWSERLIVFLYWLLSGYGLRASNALIALTVLVLVGASCLNAVGFTASLDPPSHTIVAAIRASIPGFGPMPNLTLAGKVIEVILRILGPIVYALLLLSLRARVMRKP